MNTVGVQSCSFTKCCRVHVDDIILVKITVNCTMDWTWGLRPASSWSTLLLLLLLTYLL